MANEVDLRDLVDALTERVKKLEDKSDGFTEGLHVLDKGVDAVGNAAERAQEIATDGKAEARVAADKIGALADKVHDLQWRHVWVPVIAMLTIALALACFFYSYTHDAVDNVEQKVIELRQDIKKDR